MTENMRAVVINGILTGISLLLLIKKPLVRFENSVGRFTGNILEFVVYNCVMVTTAASPLSVNIYVNDLVSFFGVCARISKFI
jgi:hypothetical protein